jgi:hypothetical protein
MTVQEISKVLLRQGNFLLICQLSDLFQPFTLGQTPIGICLCEKISQGRR